MQMSPTKALRAGYETAVASTELYRGPHLRSLFAMDIEAIFGLALWQRDTSNDEFIREQVVGTPADSFLYSEGKIISNDTSVDIAKVETFRIQWLNLWNYNKFLICAATGIEGRSHQYLPLSESSEDPADHENDIIVSYGDDLGNVM